MWARYITYKTKRQHSLSRSRGSHSLFSLRDFHAISSIQIDPKKHLETKVHDLMESNILQCLGMMLDTVVF